MKRAVTIILVTIISAVGHADLQYDNGLADNANNGASQFAADDFTLSLPTLLTEVTWIGVYGYISGEPPQYVIPADDNAVIRIYEDTGSGPESVATYDYFIEDVTRTAAGDMSGWPAFQWTVTIPETTLQPGTYFLSVVNVDLDLGPEYFPYTEAPWNWGYSDQFNGNAYRRTPADSDWSQGTADFRFALYGEIVPEPNTLILTLLGIITLIRKKVRT